MGFRWNQFGLWFKIYIALISWWEIRVCWSLNDEALMNWNPNDGEPCNWLGVHCIDSEVQILDLNSLSLEGTLAPELGKLRHLKSLVLCKNNFYGTIPKELEGLAELEVLDLRDNNFTGSIPVEISCLSELKHLLLCGNKIDVNAHRDVEKPKLPSSKWLFVHKCTSPVTSVFGGVPKLNQSELETACEDFSNIVDNFNDYIVEIAVVSTAVTSSKEWSKNAENVKPSTIRFLLLIILFPKNLHISILSPVNHKNFINLIGFCEEEEPFTRMMVFEYAPNGSLFEHLHVKEDEHLDWSTRARIIMGIGYCLQYMHHDLNPPVCHPILNSSSLYLTDDFAAKVADINYDKIPNDKSTEENGPNHFLLAPKADPETNVYNLGILLLEIISGKLPYSEEQGHLNELAFDHIKNNRSINCMIDPILRSYKKYELDVICEVIQDCIQTDGSLRPTMKDIVSKLRGVINISPEQAVPRLSPLWWSELEILSLEAN